MRAVRREIAPMREDKNPSLAWLEWFPTFEDEAHDCTTARHGLAKVLYSPARFQAIYGEALTDIPDPGDAGGNAITLAQWQHNVKLKNEEIMGIAHLRGTLLRCVPD